MAAVLSSPSLRRRTARIGASVGFVALTQLAPLSPLRLAAAANELPTVAPLTFSGSAAALGVQVRMMMPGAPATETPVDGGGPTAQVALDSNGSTTGYAAFPDPGALVLAGPGLLAGLIAGGVGGLPPTPLPTSPPSYPFFVQSDGNTPEQTAGDGPYRLEARSDSRASAASATAGFQPDVVGKVALSSATAALRATTQVISQASTDLQALTLGPVTIGQVKSTATMVLDLSGTLTPSSSLEIVGLRVGTQPVALTGEGLVLAGPATPVPTNETLASLLAPSKMTVDVLAAQEFPGRVVAPALRITMPVPASPQGRQESVIVATIGSATAALAGGSALDGLSTPSAPPPLPNGESPTALTGGAGVGAPGGAAAPLPSRGDASAWLTDSAAGDEQAWPPLAAPSIASLRSTAPPPPPMAKVGVAPFGIEGLYLVVVAGGAMAVVIGLFTRLVGVRRLWASLVG